MLKAGIKGRLERYVTAELSARSMCSGELEVYATLAMAALIEETAWRSVAPELDGGEGTVGTRLSLSHLSATPVGCAVRCETELIEADGRRLVFRAEVYDSAGKIGEAEHERFIVQNERFLAKAQKKLG